MHLGMPCYGQGDVFGPQIAWLLDMEAKGKSCSEFWICTQSSLAFLCKRNAAKRWQMRQVLGCALFRQPSAAAASQ